MSKIKMRCITCGKWFQSANAKEVTCPECTQKARREKMAVKNTPPVSNKPAGPTGLSSNSPARPPAPPKPRNVQGGTSHWLEKLDDVKVGQPEQPPTRPKLPTPPAPRDNRGGNYRNPMTGGPGNYREDRGPARGPGAYRVSGTSGLSPTIGQRPRQPLEGNRGPRPDRPGGRRPGGPRDGARPGQKPRMKTPKPPPQPKPKREKTPPPPPFTPSEEQIKQVEERYLELATPSEYDGIRTQIAKELSIPKKAVKKIVKELRDRQNIPSWWELQTYKGSPEELESIKATYLPYLPVPPVGVHKNIAETLSLKPGTVYQAIKAIRQEMNLPQYNDPSLHAEELAQKASEKQAKAEESSTPTPEQAETPASDNATEESTPVTTSEDAEQVVTTASAAPESQETVTE